SEMVYELPSIDLLDFRIFVPGSSKRMKRRAAFSSARRFNSYTFVCTSYVSSFVPGVPLLSALPLGRAFMIELPIALWARGTPRQLHSRRHAVVGSRPLALRSETLRCATRVSTTRLCPIGARSPRARLAHSHFP